MNKKEIQDIIWRLLLCVIVLLFLGAVYLIVYSLFDCTKNSLSPWISFWGSIIGGLLTLGGVWWTIVDQDKKRKEELSIQYQPILSARMVESKEIDKLCSELILLFEHDGFNDIDNEKAPYMIELINTGRGEIRDATFSIKKCEVICDPFTEDNRLNLEHSLILGDKWCKFLPINGSYYLIIMVPKQKIMYYHNSLIRIGVSLNISVNGFITETIYKYLLTFYIDIHVNETENRIDVDSLTLKYIDKIKEKE